MLKKEMHWRSQFLLFSVFGKHALLKVDAYIQADEAVQSSIPISAWLCMYIGLLYACSGGLLWFVLQFAFSTIHGSGGAAKNVFRHSSASMYYTERKLKNKIRGGLGTRLHLYFFNDRNSASHQPCCGFPFTFNGSIPCGFLG